MDSDSPYKEINKGAIFRGGFLPPRDFFLEIVSPNVDLFIEDPGSKQFAFNAAVGLYHMAEYVYEFANEYKISWFPYFKNNNGGSSAYRKSLLDKCPEFGIAEAVALVYKHYRLDSKRAKKIAPSISSIKREAEILGSNINFDEYPEEMRPSFGIDFSKPYPKKEQIVVYSPDGNKYVLTEILSIVRNMWVEEINSISMDAIFPTDLKPPK